MNHIVLDASVAVKWLLPTGEPFKDKALEILDRYDSDQLEITVPDLFWVEIANALWKAVRLGRCTTAEAERAFVMNREYRFPTESSLPRLGSALAMGIAAGLAVYDCIYVALAHELGAQLVTADERLASALAGRYQIRLLGAI